MSCSFISSSILATDSADPCSGSMLAKIASEYSGRPGGSCLPLTRWPKHCEASSYRPAKADRRASLYDSSVVTAAVKDDSRWPVCIRPRSWLLASWNFLEHAGRLVDPGRAIVDELQGGFLWNRPRPPCRLLLGDGHKQRHSPSTTMAERVMEVVSNSNLFHCQVISSGHVQDVTTATQNIGGADQNI